MGYRVVEYAHKYQRDIIELIAPIQQTELNVAVTIEDQPDLQNIPHFTKQAMAIFGWL